MLGGNKWFVLALGLSALGIDIFDLGICMGDDFHRQPPSKLLPVEDACVFGAE
jgi:hypothetical protein